jgi:hypothetical protein
MLRYVFLSVFALLLLTACGGNDLDKFLKTMKCVECDLHGANLTAEVGGPPCLPPAFPVPS